MKSWGEKMKTAARKNMDEYSRIMSDVIKDRILDLSNILSVKDNYTFLHSQRVLDLCYLIGFEMMLAKDQIEDLALAAFFHDIGKIFIPDKILKNPGVLSEEDMNTMQTHSSIGAWILRASGGSRESVKASACHHERHDGKGYPYGLHGKNIPLISRIISVADAYDAMTSKRCYTAALEKEEAILRLEACGGSQFDPGIVEVFIERIALSQADMLEAV